ncbi:ndufa5, NADH-ubiquinone oxidoreductase subunit [Cichlidogyrus casuarinus]|uniref:Ndufa5, NADH-ubiquinone oxidoreductase subunit n=1 Tax=Cichlidogyrus casuarinus TaxID=1844966 RepID=A0ABD2QLK6_9PLAT
MQALKKSTYLAGLAVSKTPHASLMALYNRTLKVLQTMPTDYAYRKATEDLVKTRLNLVKQHQNVEELEHQINAGQIEEVIVQAQREYDLCRDLLKWQPWQPLIEDAPTNQWKWPPI